MFTQSCFIRKNTPELREKLQNLGYRICPCCKFKNAVWLVNYFDYDMPNIREDIHGIGFFDSEFNEEGFTVQDMLDRFLYEDSETHIDCGENEDLFLALVGYRDDKPDHQWYIWEDEGGRYNPNDKNSWRKYMPGEKWEEWWWFEVRKATVEEIIEYFKKN